MAKRFWFQWSVLTVIAVILSVIVGFFSGQWFFGILSYFVFGMVKDSILLSVHLEKPFDDNQSS
jgi:hypothetical protein